MPRKGAFFGDVKVNQLFKRSLVICLITGAVLPSFSSMAAKTGDKTVEESKKDRQNNSRISADEMEVNMKTGLARFKGNVIISDNEMTLSCDQMTVVFTKKQKISKVTGEGHVVIVEPQNKRKATARKADYDLEKGTIVLTGNPVLEMADRKLYNAGSITYDLNSDSVKTTRIPGSDKQPVIEFKTNGSTGFSFDDLKGKTSEEAGKNNE